MRRLFAGAAAAALLAIGLAVSTAAPAGADVACGKFSSSLGQCVNSNLTVGGTSYNVDWYLPNGTASALMLVQHGFSRGCGNLRGTSKAIMEKGVMVLCLNADMSGGNAALGNALGDLLASRALAPPAGKPLPVNYIVGGHSAGGHFASVVGARLAARGYAGLKGAVLFDAVASDGFSANLAAISAGGTRPVLEVAARPSLINLSNNGFGALKALPNPFVGVQLVWSGYAFGMPYGGSCHTDSEGENGDVIGNVAAACTPSSTQVSRLRDLGSTWARDLATGTRTSAYWCTNGNDRTSCGSKVAGLVAGSLPVASLIPA
ncbi:MAG: hypothetical protein U0P45_14175 [Acidimicrobiales bacterium]